MTVEKTDQFIVSRSSTNYRVEQQQLMAKLEDTDYMLVNRNGVDFRATGKDIKDSLEKEDSPPSVSGATLVGSGPGFAGETFTTQPQNYDAGSPAATPGLKARVSGPFAVVGETSPITGVDDRDLPDLGAAANWSYADAGSGAYLFAEKEGDHSGTYVYNNTNSNNIVWTAPTGGKLKGTGDKVYLAWNSRYTGATQYAGTVCRITTQFGAVDVTCVPATTTEAFLVQRLRDPGVEVHQASGELLQRWIVLDQSYFQ